MSNLLLVEDDATLGYILKEYLEMKEYSVDWVTDGREALGHIRQRAYDLCLLDIMMPEIDGFELAALLRKEDGETPFIFLTARSLKVDVLKGFNLGADDYIVKPVDEEELLARIQVVLRRSRPPEPSPAGYTLGRYRFDFNNQTLTCDEQERRLTEREAQLLRLLCDHRGRLLSRQKVLKNLWNQNDYFTRRSMDVFISRLRKYLAGDPAIRIENVYGSGFILEVRSENSEVRRENSEQ